MSFNFRNSGGIRQRLDKEENDSNGFCEKHDSYELKWDGEHDTTEYRNLNIKSVFYICKHTIVKLIIRFEIFFDIQ